MIRNDLESFKNLDVNIPDSLSSMDLRFNALSHQRGYRMFIATKLKNIKMLDNEPVTVEDMVYCHDDERVHR
jgi:hypothetical protein